ncbi:MAG: histidinol dehydrogenase [Firmicutes bacterium]|nr:histidinol dehydrogenase [Bacillota bacterium]
MLLQPRDPAQYLEALRSRRAEFYPEIEAQVRAILAEVRRRGDEALYDFTARFDGVDLRPVGLEVTPEEWAEGEARVEPELRRALEAAARNIAEFHRAQVPRSWFITREDGSVLGQKVTPVDRAGLYVPGGQAPLYSCLLMTAIPARVAGVPEVILCTPPGRDGRLHPAMLAAARIAGVDRIFKVGGAQAVAAMAYGTQTVPRVSVIAGPGNYYVTLAKKLVFGPVGVDMLAGPTELLIIDDGSADPRWVAADLLSQAEHRGGTVVLVTTDPDRAGPVNAALAEEVARHPDPGPVAAGIRERGALLVARDLAEAADLANAIAPEHLELLIRDPWALLPAIRNAGAIFLGPWTPEALGDYIAGPSNVIPTEGTAAYASPVGVETFLKRSSVVAYSPGAFRAEAPLGARMAEGEGLPGHARAFTVRLGEGEGT